MGGDGGGFEGGLSGVEDMKASTGIKIVFN